MTIRAFGIAVALLSSAAATIEAQVPAVSTPIDIVIAETAIRHVSDNMRMFRRFVLKETSGATPALAARLNVSIKPESELIQCRPNAQGNRGCWLIDAELTPVAVGPVIYPDVNNQRVARIWVAWDTQHSGMTEGPIVGNQALTLELVRVNGVNWRVTRVLYLTRS